MASRSDRMVMRAAPGPLRLAGWLAFGVPAALLGGALAFQFWGGLFPCEMCWWQRYAHIAALALALPALVMMRAAARGGTLVALAGLCIAVAAGLAGYHAGVEYHWWQGFTACTSEVKFGGGDPLTAIMAAPTVRCDEVQWKLAGISLAGFNFLISGATAVAIFGLLARGHRA